MSARKCNATSKRTGEQCKANAVTGSDKCRHHGGKSLKGTASPRFKHGRDSRYTLVRLQDSYERNLKDQEIIELQDDIAMLRALTQESFEHHMDVTPWEEVDKAFKELRRSMYRSNSDPQQVNLRLREMGEVIGKGVDERRNREHQMNNLERVSRVVSREHKHRIDEKMAITQEEMANYIAAIVGVITSRVKDRTVLNAITNDLLALDEELSGLDNGQPNLR